MRGGFVSAHDMTLLDSDLIVRTPKLFIGYSDITTLLMFVTLACETVAFHGPMLDRRLARGCDGYDRESFERALCRAEPMGELAPPGLTIRSVVNPSPIEPGR